MKLPPFSKTYDGRTVLDFPGLELEPGKIYGVIGANGSGKSTFAKILSGVLPADRKGSPTDVSVGYMPQKNYAFRMSTRSNILLGNPDEKKCETLMDALQLKHLAQKRADRLSGGETARMALARLMMKKFDLVILDEPTAAMDMETTLISEACIRQYVQETGCTLILVTHSLQQARRLADGILFFRSGKLAESGTKQILDSPAQEATKEFLNFYGMG